MTVSNRKILRSKHKISNCPSALIPNLSLLPLKQHLTGLGAPNIRRRESASFTRVAREFSTLSRFWERVARNEPVLHPKVNVAKALLTAAGVADEIAISALPLDAMMRMVRNPMATSINLSQDEWRLSSYLNGRRSLRSAM